MRVPEHAPLRRVVGQDRHGDLLECGHHVDPCVRGNANSHRCGVCQQQTAAATIKHFGGLRRV